MSRKPTQDAEQITIKPPNLGTIAFEIEGTAPYVQNRFAAKTIMMADQAKGQAKKSRKDLKPKDFEAMYENAKHISGEGWCGIPAPAFRAAMVSACRTIGYVMTKAKLAVFVLPDGFCGKDETPLVKITKGKPKRHDALVRIGMNQTDIHSRPMWAPGWRAVVRIQFDMDMLTPQDIGNLLARVGFQVGVGEGRPDSRASCGMGWGLFRIVESKEV